MDKLELIKRNCEEVVNEDELKNLLKKKNYSAYIGFAPTGRIHVGYLIPLVKIADFIKVGFKFKFLIADMHAFLDDKKTPWELLDLRSKYYEEAIKAIFKAIHVDTKNLEFVKGSDFQLNKDYMLDVLHLTGELTVNRCKRAASEVVRFKEDPKLGGFLYPIMQVLDPFYMKIDVCFSGIDQRGIYMLGREVLPKLKNRTLTCVFTPLLPGLNGGKMSASDEKSKIDLLDSEKDVVSKVNKAYCPEGVVEDNGVLTFIQYVVFPLKDQFKVERPEKFGGGIIYKRYEDLEKDFIAKKLHPADLKKQLSEELNKILNPIRKSLENKKDLIKKAYS
ncbi:MAG: tyrosine--tRNA ligase [Nanoarchaeota archaeon]|nr:tyrosine--tRNA ligase [Nanoarchaeota archaeon]